MNVCVLLFAEARDHAGTSELTLSLDDGATLADLKRQLAQEFPQLESLANRSAWAIDQRYATEDQPLSDGQEIALIPPVSGG